jgi:hypothetical protein
VTLTVEANSNLPCTFQWFRNDLPISGAVASVFTLTNIGLADEAAYRVEIKNCAGSIISDPAYIFLNHIVTDAPHQGTVVNFSGSLLPPGLTNIIAISAGAVHALALRANGTVVAWGNQDAHNHNLTNVPTSLQNVTAICAGDDFSLALTSDRQIVAWGDGACANVPEGLHEVKAMAAGSRHCLALRTDGTVVEWGPQLTLPGGLPDVAAIAATGDLSLIVYSNGTMELVGSPTLTLTQSPSSILELAGDETFYALASDRHVVNLTSSGLPVPALAPAKAISARNDRCLALHTNSTVSGWGNVAVPRGLTNVFAISAGGLYCLALVSTPHQPQLRTQADNAGHITLSAPLAVSGFALESTAQLTEPFQRMDLSSGILHHSDAREPALILNANSSTRYFRFRKL